MPLRAYVPSVIVVARNSPQMKDSHALRVLINAWRESRYKDWPPRLVELAVVGVVSCNLNGDVVYELKKATVAANA